jgi:hypothetical protein
LVSKEATSFIITALIALSIFLNPCNYSTDPPRGMPYHLGYGDIISESGHPKKGPNTFPYNK